MCPFSFARSSTSTFMNIHNLFSHNSTIKVSIPLKMWFPGGNLCSRTVPAARSYIKEWKMRVQTKYISSFVSMGWCQLYSGAIICAHCNCMAGAGEACSHISALVYAVMAKGRIQNETTCTSQICSWLQPSLRTELYHNIY